MDILTQIFAVAFFAAAIRLSTPLIAAALGEVFAERAGIINVGIEGMMLLGAFVAVVASYYTHNPWLGVLAAVASAGALGLVHAFASIALRLDQIVSGIAINLFVLGGTSSMLRVLFTDTRPQVEKFEPIRIPLCADLPVIGPIFCQQYMLVYVVLGLVILGHFVLFRTTLGLQIRAVGEHPKAADTAGIDVVRIRYACVIFAGMMAGLAGSFLSLAQVGVFSDNMTVGKGGIALGAVVFGRWNPVGATLGALLFGAVEVLSIRAQAYGLPIPHELLLALPYVVTILVFAGLIGQATSPAALTRPYSKEMR